MLKDNSTIINELVFNASVVMENKIEYLELVAEQFEKKGDFKQATSWRRNIPTIKTAVEIMREMDGAWA